MLERCIDATGESPFNINLREAIPWQQGDDFTQHLNTNAAAANSPGGYSIQSNDPAVIPGQPAMPLGGENLCA